MWSKALVLLLLLSYAHGNYLFASEMVNPHWTGIHCTECHLSEQGKELRFKGDHMELCNRCHAAEGVSSDPHPVAVEPEESMRISIPAGWPLQDDTITCLTCHDPLLQMTENLPRKLINPSFVRQPFSASPASFCFTCHRREQYRKKNPHLQLDSTGAMVEEQCLYCHPSAPDPAQADRPSLISLKNEEKRLCGSCHPGKDTNHPVRGDHLVAVPDTMKDILAVKTPSRDIYLPVFNNTIACSTCHNPHQKGVIERPEAKRGSGEEYFLRLGRGKDLCVACHRDIKTALVPGWLSERGADAPTTPENLVEHKPVSEQKCKACHAIDGPTDGMQEPVVLCVREGCHDTRLLTNTRAHEVSVLKHCTFCHNPHSSRYKKLLYGEEDSLCATCHPLLRDRRETPLIKQDHEVLSSYAATIGLPSAYECSFCHSTHHKNDMDLVSTELCAQCHLHLRDTVSVNAHRQVAEKSCSACHDPHTAPYLHNLKEPRETYKNFDVSQAN